MKKFLCILVFSLCGLFTCFGSPIKNYKLNVPIDSTYISKIYSMTQNGDSIMINNNKYLPINRYLELENDQKEFFYQIHDDMQRSLNNLAIKKDDGVEEFNRHLFYNLRNAKMILEDYQYRKYLRAIQITLNNNGLTKYLLKSKV